ncbi:MAG: peptide deformylase [Flavobacteriales bacterium]|jgi:peptide deformylase|nr:MAG: peptide deformylase [Flavobacteriales bacterium]
MILPIVAYGSPVLKKRCIDISIDYKDLNLLIQNMWETMYAASGVGLAAPQIGLSIRLFVVDASPFSNDENLSIEERNNLSNFKEVFINPALTPLTSEVNTFNEGCLSIPDIREDIVRENEILIEYLDENFNKKKLKLNGLRARVVQHEYDHIEGILFTDKLSSFKKRLIKTKLNNISNGKVNSDYLMSFHVLKK